MANRKGVFIGAYVPNQLKNLQQRARQNPTSCRRSHPLRSDRGQASAGFVAVARHFRPRRPARPISPRRAKVM